MEIIRERSASSLVFYRGVWRQGLRPFHWHDKLELLLPLDHRITVLLDGERYEAAPGDIVLIGAQAVHAFAVEEDETAFLLGQFPYHILCTGGEIPPAVRPVIPAAEIAADPVLDSEVHAILAALACEEGIVPHGTPSVVLQSLFTALYFLLARHFARPEQGKRTSRERQDFYRIVSYVNEHFSEPITVGSIAAALYIDRGKLSRLFLLYAGRPLTEYLTGLRIAMADRLLREGSSVTVAALESGFQSVRTFHDAYSRVMRMPPRSAKARPGKAATSKGASE